MNFCRHFSSTRGAAAKYFARTTVTPGTGSLLAPTHFAPKLVILLSTPQNLPTAIENAIAFYQLIQMQVVVAGVDTVVPNGARNGISELWLDEYLDIGNSQLLEKDKPENAKTNWKPVEATLSLDIGRDVDVSLANTAFTTNNLATLFYFQPQALQQKTKDPNMGEMLLGLSVKLPKLEPALAEPQSVDRWTQLTTEELIVSECTGNLAKKINGEPASKVLQNNEQLMGIGSKDTKVYVKIHRAGSTKKYEVIAGGGGWGVKADLLAVSPEAKLQVGDRLEFFMVTPSDRFTEMKSAVVLNQFLFECTPEATSYSAELTGRQALDNVFGCGCESGFSYDKVNYRSPGEALSFSF